MLLATLFGATGGPDNSDLYVIDTTTGAATSLGPIGFSVTGLAFDPLTGVLYGATSQRSPNSPRSLITIDPTTGSGTLVGPHGLGSSGVLADIAFDATGTLYGWNESGDDLVTVNLATGAATVVGNSGVSTRGSGLADVGGTLLFANGTPSATPTLNSVNKATGQLTVIAPFTGIPGGADNIGALDFDPDSGQLFGAAIDISVAARPAFLVTINTTTGVITNIGQSVNRLDAIAFQFVLEFPELNDCEAAVLPDPFNPGDDVLLVNGTSVDDAIKVVPVPRGRLRVFCNGENIGTFPSSSFDRIVAIGNEGNDAIVINAAILKPSELFGDEGIDVLQGGKGSDVLHGGDNDDVLFGGNGHDTLLGDGGVDKLYGQRGNDRLFGGDETDFLYGGAGNDRLFGEEGNDHLFGETGNDVALGGAGDDHLYGGADRDILVGGEGLDFLFGGPADDILVGDSTESDEDETALDAILAEWTSRRSYVARVNNIIALGIVVIDDGSEDELYGQGGRDWFISSDDEAKDNAPNEIVTSA